MRILFLAVALISVGFGLHWMLWRIRIPGRQTLALLAIFTGVLVAGLWATRPGATLIPESWRWHDAWELLHISQFHIAMMLGYIVAYSAIEERSPSMTILSSVDRAGASGRTRQEVQSLLRGVSPVEIRLRAMDRDGMVVVADGLVSLTAKGRAWADVFSAWRRFLRYEKGG